MIISVNSKPELPEFQMLMKRTDNLLNEDALKRPYHYVSRGGNPLEDDVLSALIECSIGTPFQGTIEKVSGQKFPDIVASKFYGVEVKSTKENHWTSTGSSILETTRVADVERIYMTFGKLGGNPIEFRSRPYEECLCGIAVTHMPRYLIDMRLKPGETIFDKIGITYDDLRKMDNPIPPVAKYYRSRLKPGESLWWASDSGDEAVSATVRLWSNVSPDEKAKFTTYGCIHFPEIFAGNYDRYALWLTSQGVVCSHIRDQFSAGGQEEMLMPNGEIIKFPGVYRRVKNYANQIIQFFATNGMPTKIESIPVRSKLLRHRLLNWFDKVSKASAMDYETSMDALSMLFFQTSYRDTQDKKYRDARDKK